MTTSAPGACSASQQCLCSVLLSLQSRLHPFPLPQHAASQQKDPGCSSPPHLRLLAKGAFLSAALVPSPSVPTVQQPSLPCSGEWEPQWGGLECPRWGGCDTHPLGAPTPHCRVPPPCCCVSLPSHSSAAPPHGTGGGHWGPPQHCSSTTPPVLLER